MFTETFNSQLENLAEQAVLADLFDLPGLAQMHTGFLETSASAASAKETVIASALAASAKLVESLILEECADPAAGLEAARQTIAQCQTISKGFAPASPKVFPKLLQLDGEALGTVLGAVTAPENRLLAPFDPMTGDVDLLAEFVTEAMEHLENAEVALLALETNPDDAESLDAVFRAFHTIKGVAGMLHVDAVQALAHESENLLDKVRRGEIPVQASVMDVALRAVDFLRRLIGSLSEALKGGLMVPPPDLPELIVQIQCVQNPDCHKAVVTKAESTDRGRPLGEILVDMGVATHGDVAEAIQLQAALLPPTELGELLVRANVVTRSRVDRALEMQRQQPDKRLGEILVEQEWATQRDIETALQKQALPPQSPLLGEVLIKSGKVSPGEVAQGLRRQQAAQRGGNSVKEVLKVDAERLDKLVDMIGELVIVQSMVTQTDGFRKSASAMALRNLDQLDRITRDLQQTGMSLRMVPLRSTFQKITRLVRDLAQKTGKEVEFVVSGEDTEIDKSMVDQIGDPLVHMIRNAVDHGLEDTAAERMEAGKPAKGTIELHAFHRHGNLVIEIRDDGRGLDRDRILAKAHERGIEWAGDHMSDPEVWNLIFEAGFSTAKTVTDVSGRGVGMDVVRRNVAQLRGRVDIQSVLGRGTTFSIRLPLTLAIIDGMALMAGNERYITPIGSVVRAIRPEGRDIQTFNQRGEMLSLQGHLIPLFRLKRILDMRAPEPELTQSTVLVVEDNGKQIGLVADELLGQQQTVVKTLGRALGSVPGIAGGAIMPDGRVGLILDVAGLIRITETEEVKHADESLELQHSMEQ
ncbi:MAG: hypothetical protein AMXMBFR84_29050 [Candidatus Hydrogenedentota bacterium]